MEFFPVISQFSALYRNDEQSAVAVARSLEECSDDIAQHNYQALMRSLVNEHMRRKIIRIIIARSKRFGEWLTNNSKDVFCALHQNKSLNVIFDLLQKISIPTLESGKLISFKMCFLCTYHHISQSCHIFCGHLASLATLPWPSSFWPWVRWQTSQAPMA